MKRALCLLCLFSAPLAAQVSTFPYALRTYAITDLPTCSASIDGRLFGVYDGTDADDCSTGGGSDSHICMCDGTAWVAGSGGAPADADYIVGTANATLTNEIVAGTAPGGELGGTWGSPTVDSTHAGSTHAPTAADYLVGSAQAGLSAEIVAGTVPGGELGGTWGSPTVDSTHAGGSHHGDGANCSALQAPLGVDASGAVQTCWSPVAGPTSSTNSHLAVFDGTTGKLLKQMTSGTALLTPTLSVTGGLTTAGTLDVNGTGSHDIEGSTTMDRIFFEANPTDVGTALDICRNTSFEVGDCASRSNLKRDVGAVGRAYSLGIVQRITPRHFTWLDSGLPALGLVVEELVAAHPALANWSEGEPVQPNRNALLAVLVGAVQELASRVNELEATCQIPGPSGN